MVCQILWNAATDRRRIVILTGRDHANIHFFLHQAGKYNVATVEEHCRRRRIPLSGIHRTGNHPFLLQSQKLAINHLLHLWKDRCATFRDERALLYHSLPTILEEGRKPAKESCQLYFKVWGCLFVQSPRNTTVLSTGDVSKRASDTRIFQATVYRFTVYRTTPCKRSKCNRYRCDRRHSSYGRKEYRKK